MRFRRSVGVAFLPSPSPRPVRSKQFRLDNEPGQRNESFCNQMKKLSGPVPRSVRWLSEAHS